MEKREVVTPAKKQKLSESLDPLEVLHSDVFELIFQHFRNDDVLKSSEVSNLWFEITESSSKCTDKLHLKVVVPYGRDVPLNFHCISSELISQRKYQNIYLHNFRDIVPEVVKTLTGRSWRKVFISTRNLKSRKDFLDIMSLIEQTVENLSISSTSLENPAESDGEEVRLTFPQLKNLHLNRCYGLLMKEISDDCRNLRILEIDLDHLTWSKQQNFLRKILAKNEQLETLTLWRCSAEYAFQLESIPSYRFKLKTFFLKNGEQTTVEEENCLFKFLESQADSLETLRLEDWYGIGVFKLMFKMSKLKDLTIDLYDVENTIDWDNLELNPSFSIKKFYIDSYRNNRTKANIFNALFTAMPDLRFLTMDYLDNVSLQSIGLRCQMLEELEILELKASRVDDPLFFPRLKRFQCEDRIKMRIKQRINRKEIHRRSTFEHLVLTAKPFFVTQ